ncbi:MAG: CRISPR-associated protein Cas4 [Candidatus Micrarchaeota archaeon]
MNERELLTMRDVLNYLYCPRIVFYEKVLRQRQYQTYKQDHGIMKHDDFVAKARRIVRDEWKNFPIRRFEVSVRSSRLGYRTRADMLMSNEAGEYRVVQFKPSIPDFGVPFAWKIQLVFEAMAAEETLGISCAGGYVAPYEEGHPVAVCFDERLRLRAQAILNECKELLMSEALPSCTPYASRCTDCMYRGRICEGNENLREYS